LNSHVIVSLKGQIMMMIMMMKLTVMYCVCLQRVVRCWIVHSTCVNSETILNLCETRFAVDA